MTPLVTETRLPRDRLETVLRKMVSQRIVVVGDAMLDIYLSGDAERISPEAAAEPGTEGPLMAELERAMVTADALVLEDYNKGTLTQAVIERAMALAQRRGVAVVVDPKFKHFFAYRGATVFKPNRRELEQAMGAALDLGQPEALPATFEKLGVDNLLLTLGGEGMVLVTKDQQISRIPAMAREVFDVSGAGDTVTAWVGTSLAAGASVREAAQVANYAAGVEVGKSGVATVAPAEVLAAHEAMYDQLGRLRRGGLL